MPGYCEALDPIEEEDDARCCTGVCSDWSFPCPLLYVFQLSKPEAVAFDGIIGACEYDEGSCGVGVDC